MKWDWSFNTSLRYRVTRPMIGSGGKLTLHNANLAHSPCSRVLSSRTTKTIFAIRQSRMNRSLRALKYGSGVSWYVLVLYTIRSFRCTSQ